VDQPDIFQRIEFQQFRHQRTADVEPVFDPRLLAAGPVRLPPAVGNPVKLARFRKLFDAVGPLKFSLKFFLRFSVLGY
jgi:hypothetical protein